MKLAQLIQAAIFATLFTWAIALGYQDIGWPALAVGVPLTAWALWDVLTDDHDIDSETEDTRS